MGEVLEFGTIVLVVASGFFVALLSSKLTERFPVPGPALFLIAAAVASDLFPGLAERLPIREVERIGVVALVVILFDGGMHVGLRRFRIAGGLIASLGIVGTFATAGVMAAAAHVLFDFSWTTAGILGAALAPTDPAVMFSVLGRREVSGRTATILEGESGANDPVGIALMIGLIELATHDDASLWTVVREFSIQMTVGLAVGAGASLLAVRTLRGISLPNEALYPLRTLALAGVVYGLATVAHGSGFLAVFVAGLVVGDARAPYKAEIERFHTSLASLAEIVVFVVFGLTLQLGGFDEHDVWLPGIALAAILALVARPIVVGLLLLPARLRLGERLFVIWSGLKGAVPIFLGAFAVLGGVEGAERIYEIVFVVVTLSVLVQGTSMPFLAGRFGVPMRDVQPSPWRISIPLRHEPAGIGRYVVDREARAAGTPIGDLPLGDHAWISLVVRDGRLERPGGSFVIEPHDVVHVLGEDDDVALRRLFEGARG